MRLTLVSSAVAVIVGVLIGLAIAGAATPNRATVRTVEQEAERSLRPGIGPKVEELRGYLWIAGVRWPGPPGLDPQKVNWPKPHVRGVTYDGVATVYVTMKNEVESVMLGWNEEPSNRHQLINAVSLGIDRDNSQSILDRITEELDKTGEVDTTFETPSLSIRIQRINSENDEDGKFTNTIITFTCRRTSEHDHQLSAKLSSREERGKLAAPVTTTDINPEPLPESLISARRANLRQAADEAREKLERVQVEPRVEPVPVDDSPPRGSVEVDDDSRPRDTLGSDDPSSPYYDPPGNPFWPPENPQRPPRPKRRWRSWFDREELREVDPVEDRSGEPFAP